tara:strand:+ start:934 stop:1224 length:291 start_codon:yes stop_codon:yes gene_type:complete
MDNKLNIDKINSDIINYFTKKRAWEYEFIRYATIKKSISYITKIKKVYLIRKIFLSLVDDGTFLKKQNIGVRSYLYKFKNPNEARLEKKNITIVFE